MEKGVRHTGNAVGTGKSWGLLLDWEFWTRVRDGGERKSIVKWILGSAGEPYSWLRRGAAITQEVEW